MIRMVMRLAPSHAGGKSEAGIVIGSGRSSTLGRGVPSAVKTGPFSPAVTVPQEAGGIPGKGVIVQQVAMPRTRKNPPMINATAATQKMICAGVGRPNLMFLKKSKLFILASYIPYPAQVAPGLPLPSVAATLNFLPSPAS